MDKPNLNLTFIIPYKQKNEDKRGMMMKNLCKSGILLIGLLFTLNTQINAQAIQDDFITVVKKSALYKDFDDNFRVLILNIITHPNSYYKRSEEKTYLTFKVVNEEYQMMLDEAALDSNILNIEMLLISAYGRRTYYKVENGQMIECWYKERGVTYSNTSESSSTIYTVRSGYYDFVEHVKKFNSFLTQKRTKNIRSKSLRRAYRLINSIRDTQYSRLQKMIKRYDRFVAKRIRKQERKLAKDKKRYEKQQENDNKKPIDRNEFKFY